MAFPEVLEVSLKSMVFEIRWQRLPIPKFVYYIEKERGVIAAFLNKFEILLELGGLLYFAYQSSRSFFSSSRSVYSFAFGSRETLLASLMASKVSLL